MTLKPMQHLNLDSGIFAHEPAQSRRLLEDMEGLFADADSWKSMDSKALMYEIHGPADPGGEAKMLYATTILQPGDVGGEFFMTRGHFHVNPKRGELMLTLKGEGKLILMDRNRECWTEPMSKGSFHDIDGAHAHRVANTGDRPLIFLVAWMSDCGHDYGSVHDRGFSGRLYRTSNGPEMKMSQ